MKYGTCEARIQDEFPNACDSNREPMTGSITLLERQSDSDASEVIAWFKDSDTAEHVAKILNKNRLD